MAVFEGKQYRNNKSLQGYFGRVSSLDKVAVDDKKIFHRINGLFETSFKCVLPINFHQTSLQLAS